MTNSHESIRAAVEEAQRQDDEMRAKRSWARVRWLWIVAIGVWGFVVLLAGVVRIVDLVTP